MAITTSTIGWMSLPGPIDLDKVEELFLLPNKFDAEPMIDQQLNIAFLRGRKELILRSDKLEVPAFLLLHFHKSGIVYSLLDVKGQLGNHREILTAKFEIVDDSLEYQEVGVQEIVWNTTTAILELSLIEFQLEADLQSDSFYAFCSKYAITPITRTMSMSITHNLYVDSNEQWEAVLAHEKEEFTRKNGTIFSDTLIVPNFDNTQILPHIECQFLFSSKTIMYAQPPVHDLVREVYQAVVFRTLGLHFLQSVLVEYQTKLKQLNEYIADNLGDEEEISWIYVDKELTSIEMEYRRVIDLYESLVAESREFLFYNFADPSSIHILEDYNRYSSERKIYFERKHRIEEQIDGIRHLLTDKGEKEEQRATERIVTVIGLLALFEVLSETLPLFPDSLAVIIRVVFLVSILPLLLILWFTTQRSARIKRRNAEHLKELVELKRKAEIVTSLINQLQFSKTQELIELSKEYLDSEISKLVKTRDQIQQQIKRREGRTSS